MKKKTKKDVGLHPIADLLHRMARASNDPIFLEKICVRAEVKFATLKGVYHGRPVSMAMRKSLLSADVINHSDVEKYCAFAQDAGWRI